MKRQVITAFDGLISLFAGIISLSIVTEVGPVWVFQLFWATRWFLGLFWVIALLQWVIFCFFAFELIITIIFLDNERSTPSNYFG